MATFGFDVSTGELHGPAGCVRVQRLVLRLADALLRAQGEVVSYAAIAAAMWPLPASPPARVAEGTRTAARKLRSALRHVGAEEQLQTLPGTGIRVTNLSPQEHEAQPSPPAALDLVLDPVAMKVRHAGREIGLSREEVAIMGALLSGHGLTTKADLLAVLYADKKMPAAAGNVLRVKVTQLRRKLRAAGVPVGIAAEYGIGYRLLVGVPAAKGR